MVYTVKDFMTKTIYTVDCNATVAEASKIMLEKNVGYLIVLDGGQPVGMISERDIVFKVVALGKDPTNVKVSEIMSKPLITVDPDATISDAVEIMVKNGLRRIPVVKDGIIYGVFTTRDLAAHFKEYEDKLVRDLLRSLSRFAIPF
ncbi:MAG: CBS domain-containing protein [archaeon YNP-LCB-024-027]|nr:CBS domain-containing protein [Candidatus Culexarchaeum yellowstonense]